MKDKHKGLSYTPTSVGQSMFIWLKNCLYDLMFSAKKGSSSDKSDDIESETHDESHTSVEK